MHEQGGRTKVSWGGGARRMEEGKLGGQGLGIGVEWAGIESLIMELTVSGEQGGVEVQGLAKMKKKC